MHWQRVCWKIYLKSLFFFFYLLTYLYQHKYIHWFSFLRMFLKDQVFLMLDLLETQNLNCVPWLMNPLQLPCPINYKVELVRLCNTSFLSVVISNKNLEQLPMKLLYPTVSWVNMKAVYYKQIFSFLVLFSHDFYKLLILKESLLKTSHLSIIFLFWRSNKDLKL